MLTFEAEYGLTQMSKVMKEVMNVFTMERRIEIMRNEPDEDDLDDEDEIE